MSMWDFLPGASGLSTEGAQSKRPAQQGDAPTQQPMRGNLKPAQQRKPSADQKRVRRQMARQSSTPAQPSQPSTATKESTAMTQPTEADLLTRLAMATTLAEQTAISAQIDNLRTARRESIAVEGSLDWDGMGPTPPTYLQQVAASLVESHEALPPATASMRHGHTDATDWLMDIAPSQVSDPVLSATARAHATQWFEGCWDAVKQDAQEFTTQAHNAAARTGTSFGLQATAAASVFLDQVKHLASREGLILVTASDTDQICPRCKTGYMTPNGQPFPDGDDLLTCRACGHSLYASDFTTASKQAAEYAGGSPKEGDTATCHADGQKIQFFAGEWMHLKGGPSHNDVHPGSKSEASSRHAFSETVDTYVSDGRTSTPVGVAAGDADDSMDEWTIGTDLNGGDPKSTTTTGDAPSLTEGDTPETGHNEQVDNPNFGQAGQDKSTFDEGNTEDKMKTQGGRRLALSATAGVDVSKVRIEDRDANTFSGEKSDGTRVTFRLSDSDAKDVRSVMFGDLGMNFSGLTIEESDIVTGTTAAFDVAAHMAAEFGGNGRGISTYANEQEQQSGEADGLSSARAPEDAPSMQYGSEVETGHSEPATQNSGEGAKDMSSPTDSDRPGGGVEWGSTAAKRPAPAHPLYALAASYKNKPISQKVATLAAGLSRCASIDASVGGVSARQIVAALANSGEAPLNVRLALNEHLAGDTATVSVIPTCDICTYEEGKTTPAIYDGKTVMGPWANMCERHFEEAGVGLGTGRGQRLVLGSRTASDEGNTCSVCGDKIAKDPNGEEPSTWHHDNGEKHDHEAKPGGGESKEGQRAPFGREAAKSDECPKCGAHMEDVTVNGDTLTAKCEACGWSGNKTKKAESAKTAAFENLSDEDLKAKGYTLGTCRTCGSDAVGKGDQWIHDPRKSLKSQPDGSVAGDAHAVKPKEASLSSFAQRVQANLDKVAEATPEDYAAAGVDAGLGVGHIWTNVACPAYNTLRGEDCICNGTTAAKTADSGKWIAQVAGVGENVWSGNGLVFDTPEEAKAWIGDLSRKWFGFDLGRVVPEGTPTREPVDLSDPSITHNFR